MTRGLQLILVTLLLSFPGPFARAQVMQESRPGSLLVFPRFDIRGNRTTTLRIENLHDTSATSVQLTVVCGGRASDAVCPSLSQIIEVAPHGTSVIDIADMNPPCKEGFLLALAVDGGQAIAFDRLTGSSRIRRGLRLEGAPAIHIQSVRPEGFALDEAGDGLQLGPEPDPVSQDYVGLPSIHSSLFSATDPNTGEGTDLVVLTLDLRVGQANPTAGVAVDFWNTGATPFGNSFDFTCWRRVPLEEVDPSFFAANLGSSEGLLELTSLPVCPLPDGCPPFSVFDAPLLGAVVEKGSGHSTARVLMHDAVPRSARLALPIGAGGSNQDPEPQDDAGATDEGQLLAVVAPGVSSLLENDSDPDGDPLQVTGHDAVSALGAAVSVQVDGSFVYDPRPSGVLEALAAGQTASDSFAYAASDGRSSVSANVQITVSGLDEAPRVLSIQPADGEQGVARDRSLRVVFDEPVAAPAGAFQIVCSLSGAHALSVSGGPLAFDLDPASDFAAGETCTLSVVPGPVQDLDADDPPDTLDSAVASSFTTLDSSPYVVSFSPGPGQVLAPNGNLVVTFSEPVELAPSAIRLLCSASGLLSTGGSQITVTDTNPVFVLDPANGFFPAERCTLAILSELISDTDSVDPPNLLTSSVFSSFDVGFLAAPLLASDDAFQVTTHLRRSVAAGASDINANDLPLHVPVFGFGPTPIGANGVPPGDTSNTAAGGRLTLEADGSFVYDPPPGFTGTDEAYYTISDTTGADVGRIEFQVSGPVVWFVDPAASGDGSGLLSDPFRELCCGPTSFATVAADAPGEIIALASGDHVGGVSLQPDQLLIGSGADGDLASLTGLDPTPGSDPLPAFTGPPPRIGTGAGIDAVQLSSGNTVRGVEIGDSGGYGLSGDSVGELQVSETRITGSGGGVRIEGGGTGRIELIELESSDAAQSAVRLAGYAGEFEVLGETRIERPGGHGVVVQDAIGDVTFARLTIQDPAGDGISLAGGTGRFMAQAGGRIDFSAPADGNGLKAVDVGAVSLGGPDALHRFQIQAVGGASDDVDHAGVHVDGADRAELAFLDIAGFGEAGGSDGDRGILLREIAEQIEVRDSKVDRIVGQGIVVETGALAGTVDVDILRNTVFGDGSAGGFTTTDLGIGVTVGDTAAGSPAGANVWIRNNLLVGLEEGGIAVDVENAGSAEAPVVVRIDGRNLVRDAGHVLVRVDGRDAAVLDLSIDGNTLERSGGQGIRVTAEGDEDGDAFVMARVTDNDVSDVADELVRMQIRGIRPPNSAVLEIDVSDNRLDLADDNGIFLRNRGNGTVRGQVTGNTISRTDAAGGSDGAIELDADGNGVSTLMTNTLIISENVLVTGIASHGINLSNLEDNVRSELTLTDNRIASAGDAVRLLLMDASADVCLDARGNTGPGGTGSPGQIQLNNTVAGGLGVSQPSLAELMADNFGAPVITVGEIGLGATCQTP